jgi:hypothetical protein
MSANPLLINKTMKFGDWLFDAELERADNAACVQYDRREAVAKSVTFADLLEEMADFTEPRAEVFMQAYRRGLSDDKHVMFVLIDQAFERIVERQLAGK